MSYSFFLLNLRIYLQILHMYLKKPHIIVFLGLYIICFSSFPLETFFHQIFSLQIRKAPAQFQSAPASQPLARNSLPALFHSRPVS